jgi:hypothetical protein
MERTGKLLIKVDCRLEGDELQVENPQFLVDMDTAAVIWTPQQYIANMPVQ